MKAVSAERRGEDNRRAALSGDDDGSEEQEGAKASELSTRASVSSCTRRSTPAQPACATCAAGEQLSSALASPDALPDSDLSPADAPFKPVPTEFKDLPLSNPLRRLYHDRVYWSNGREWPSLFPSSMTGKLAKLRGQTDVPVMSQELLEFWDAMDQTSGWDAMRRADEVEKAALAAADAQRRSVGLGRAAAIEIINLGRRKERRIRDILALDQAWLAYRAFEEENGIEEEGRIRARLALFPPAAFPTLAERNEAERQAERASHG